MAAVGTTRGLRRTVLARGVPTGRRRLGGLGWGSQPMRLRVVVGKPTERVAHDLAHRPTSDRATAAVRPRSRRRGRGRSGAAGRQVRRDVDLAELHLPVVQLPLPPGRAAVLRPALQHRDRGVRPRRARRGDDQHDADRRQPARRRPRPEAGSRATSRASATRTTSSPAARARCRRTRRDAPGTATTSSPPATSSRT